MAEQEKLVPLGTVLGGNKNYVDLIIREDVPVICVNQAARKKRSMPFKALYDNNKQFWQQGSGWEFFIVETDAAKINELAAAAQAAAWQTPAIPLSAAAEVQAEQPPDSGFGKEYESIAAMSLVQQVQHIQENKKRLDCLIAEKPRNEKKVTEALVDTARDAALVNHAALLDAVHFADGEAKKLTQGLVDSTRDMVKASSQLISDNIFNDDLMNTLVEKSNGTIIQHMTRTYLNGLAFLSYYNKIVSTSSIINKLRISFEKKYRPFYRALLPHVHPDDIALEKVFRGGMRAIPEKQFLDWAVGFLIHDIGKAAAVEYHEGEAAYNRDIVVEHVKIGYDSVMNKTNYPREAGLITGYHHEYYGDSAGYGYFRSYLDQYKKVNPEARQDFCVAFELEPMIDYEALGYFPAKVLEIIDVYDSVTDPNRKYRKALSPEEAIAMMQDEFIVKHPKIDLVLFDVFSAFVREKTKK